MRKAQTHFSSKPKRLFRGTRIFLGKAAERIMAGEICFLQQSFFFAGAEFWEVEKQSVRMVRSWVVSVAPRKRTDRQPRTKDGMCFRANKYFQLKADQNWEKLAVFGAAAADTAQSRSQRRWRGSWGQEFGSISAGLTPVLGWVVESGEGIWVLEVSRICWWCWTGLNRDFCSLFSFGMGHTKWEFCATVNSFLESGTFWDLIHILYLLIVWLKI